MTNVDLARVEFAVVSVNHFFFVPITIGLAFLAALLQTAWYHTKCDNYLRLTRFFGTLLVTPYGSGSADTGTMGYDIGPDASCWAPGDAGPGRAG